MQDSARIIARMPRLLWLAAASIALASVGCVSTEAAKPSPANPEEAQVNAAVAAWQQCVERSFSRLVALTPDRSLAAELAFRACSSEEAASVSPLVARTPAVTRAKTEFRARLRARLVAGGT